MEINSNYSHIPVQANKVVDLLVTNPSGIYVDCTFGRGGHSLLILKKLSKKGKLFVIDQDQQAYQYFLENFKDNQQITFLKGNFANLKEMLKQHNVDLVDGFLFDLGVSSPMFDDPTRGFSYRFEGKLDMRMNQDNKLDAYYVVNQYPKDKLIKIFKEYGDVKNPLRVVNKIIEVRKNKPIETTIELVDLIKSVLSNKEIYGKKHFAVQYFQAIRIEVNNEIEVLKKAVDSSIKLLNHKGRIITISFHSLEERTVKNCFANTQIKSYPKELPVNNLKSEFKIINVKNKTADLQEQEFNKRSKSSVIKILERL